MLHGLPDGVSRHGVRVSDSVWERFWEALGSGLSPAAAATVAGVSGNTGRKWARNAGYQTNREHYDTRYSPHLKEVFWEAMRSGTTPAQAAVAAGVSEHSARRWGAVVGPAALDDLSGAAARGNQLWVSGSDNPRRCGGRPGASQAAQAGNQPSAARRGCATLAAATQPRPDRGPAA